MLVIVIAIASTVYAEPSMDASTKCAIELRDPFGRLYDDYKSGLHPALIRHIIRSDRSIGKTGGWMLVTSLNALELADAMNRMPTREEFVERSLTLCEKKITPTIERPKSDKIVDNWGNNDHSI